MVFSPGEKKPAEAGFRGLTRLACSLGIDAGAINQDLRMAKRSQAQFVKWFGPLLDALRELGDSGKPREVANQIAKNLSLSDDVLDATVKSGGSRFQNQVAWARQYLVWEGLVQSSKHGTWTLTDKGRTAHLSEAESREIFKKWVAIHRDRRKEKEVNGQEPDHTDELPPEERVVEESLSLLGTALLR
jgi:restriction system protein